MNPEAVEWLEALSVDEHLDCFHPALAQDGVFASFKSDHEPGRYCSACQLANHYGTLTVIE